MSNHAGPTPIWMTEDYFENILKKMRKKSNIRVKCIDVSPGSQMGDNYVCQIFRIIVTFLQDDKEDTISIIGKLQPVSEFFEELRKVHDMFGVEAHVLLEILPALKEKFPKAPSLGAQAYFFDEDHKIIYLQDLREEGYQMVDKKKRSLDLDYCRLTIKGLATMHAQAFLLLKTRPELKSSLASSIWSHEEENVIMKIVDSGLVQVLNNIDKWSLSELQKEKLRRLEGKLYAKGFEAYKCREESFNSLLHGDCSVNNVLFKCHDDGQVRDLKFVDYQNTNYNSIGLDLNFFLFTSVDTDVLVNHLEDLLHLYYTTFITYTGELPGFTEATVRKELTERLGLGLVCMLVFRPGILAPGGLDLDAVTTDDVSTTDSNVYNDERYVSQIVQMLPLFEKHGILQ